MHLWTYKKPLGFMMNVPDIRNPVDVRDLSKEGNVESPKPVTGKIINPPLIIALADVEAGHIPITKFVPTGIDIVVHVLGFAILFNILESGALSRDMPYISDVH